jgi:hypothetical protein
MYIILLYIHIQYSNIEPNIIVKNLRHQLKPSSQPACG